MRYNLSLAKLALFWLVSAEAIGPVVALVAAPPPGAGDLSRRADKPAPVLNDLLIRSDATADTPVEGLERCALSLAS